MVASSAAAMAVPISPANSSTIQGDTGGSGGGSGGTKNNPIQADISHFTAGKTLTVDGRLGHAAIASGNPSDTFLFASVAGSDGASQAAPPLNLAIVIDRSGSMKGDRIANAIAAAVGTIERLRDGDSVTVVSFDTEAQVVVPPTRASSSTRPSIEAAIQSIRLGGDTCISCGLELGMTELSLANLGGDRVTRMLLLSDGATNHGIKDIGGLRAMAGRMRDRGCSISTIGVDVEFDEKVMAAIAVESNGRHYFVANPSGLPAIFAQEFDNLLSTVARDSELAIDLAPGVELEQVFDRSFRREGSRIIVPFGTFSAKQEKTVLMKLRVSGSQDGMQPVANVKLSYRDLVERSNASCQGDLALMVTSDGTAPRELDPFVAARVERSRTAQTLTEANLLFEQGRIGEAQAKLARQETELRTSGTSARASAKKSPSADPFKSGALDRDFESQLAAVASAEANFAPATAASVSPGRGGGGGFSPAPAPKPQDTHEGKAQVRSNQDTASQLGF
jgi:Ca-activated chloride channel family protein